MYIGTLEASQTLTIRLFDRDLIGQDYLGKVSIPLSKLIHESGDSLEAWFPVEEEPTENFNKGTKLPGELLLKLHYPKTASLRGAVKRENPKKYYKIEKTLGQGAFGEVKRAVNRKTDRVCAVKILKKKKLEEQSKKLLEREIAIMSKLHHPNIVELIEAFDTPKNTYLILELVTGGELFDEIITRDKSYCEKDAADMVRQILLAISYMNSMGISHRDLKPENLCSTRNTISRLPILVYQRTSRQKVKWQPPAVPPPTSPPKCS